MVLPMMPHTHIILDLYCKNYTEIHLKYPNTTYKMATISGSVLLGVHGYIHDVLGTSYRGS